MRIAYFRVFGYGLHWKDTRRHRLLWSERERIYVQWRIGPWLITPLKRGERGWRRKDAASCRHVWQPMADSVRIWQRCVKCEAEEHVTTHEAQVAATIREIFGEETWYSG